MLSPALSGSFVLQHFKRSNVIKVRDGIMLAFNLGLPYMIMESIFWGPKVVCVGNVQGVCQLVLLS